MSNLMDKKEMLGIVMESPLYLGTPSRGRLNLVQQDERRQAQELRTSILNWIKTGIFHYPPFQGKF